jgi:putative ABC transport system permease protein
MSLWSRLVNVIRGDRLIADIDEELESHVAEAIAQGRDPEEARRAFGALLQHRDSSRDTRRLVWLDDLVMDVRYAVRVLARQPGFLAAAVLSLALGIGANTAIFGLIDAVMLRAMPVSAPQQLVEVVKRYDSGQTGAISFPLFEYLRDGNSVFSGMFAQGTSLLRTDIDVRGSTDRLNAALVSGGYYGVLGLSPAAGRLLVETDDVPGASSVAVISDGYWQRRFARDPSVIGATFAVNGASITIVGVTPPAFSGTVPGSDTDVTFPLSMAGLVQGRDDSWRRRDGYNFLSVMGRLRPGTTVGRADAAIRAIFSSRIQSEAGRAPDANERRRILGQTVSLVAGHGGFSGLRARFSEPLLVLMALVGFVLLLACANLSSLLLARAAARQREILVRCAIGAGRGRLVRQFLTESLVLAGLGAAAGVALAAWLRSALVAMMANGGTLILPAPTDWRLFTFLAGVALTTCVLVGLVPALHAARTHVGAGLTDARGATRGRLGRALVVAQIALSLVLLVGATLFVGALVRLYGIDAGFRREGILTFTLDTRDKPESPHRQAVEGGVLQRINALPGVASTSAVQILFISGGGWNGSVHIDGYMPAPGEELITNFNAVAPRFFDTMGTPLVAGRDFDQADMRSSPANKVAIVNEAFAKAYFAGSSPLGRRLSMAGWPDRYEIVGVAKDAKYLNLKEAFPKTVYFPLGQNRLGAPTLLVHTTASDPMWVRPNVEAVLRELDPAMRLGNVRSFAQHVDRSILNERIMATLGAFFGALALVVACLGIFGVMAFQVAQRTREFGVRMSLGATRRGVTALVLRDVSVMLLAGCLIGGVAAAALSRVAKSFLFGVTATDPAAFLFAVVLLAVAGFSAACVPAWRAARVDPTVALRHE